MAAESYPQPFCDFVDKAGYLSTSYPHSAVRPAKVIHKPENVIHISTRAGDEKGGYPHYPQNIHKVIPKVIHTSVQAGQKFIHIVENVINISTKLFPKLSTLSSKTNSNHPETQYLVIFGALSTIYGVYPQSYPQSAAKTVKIASFRWRNRNPALPFRPLRH